MSLIAWTAITDEVLNDFGQTAIEAKITLNDAAFTDIIERNNVESDDVEDTPYHFILQKWAIAWVCREICLDNLGVNNLDIADFEKYNIKYKIYMKLEAELASQITPKVLTGNVETVRDRSTRRTGLIFRS